MTYRVRPVRDLGEYRAAFSGIGHYFAWQPTEEDADRFSRLLPFARMHAVFDGQTIVGGAGAIPFTLTIPGGPVPCAGVTVVGVLPSHRRRGLLRRMMESQLRDIRERGEPIAALWASEEGIYGRFGYGMAALALLLDVEQTAVRIRDDLPREGSLRLIDIDEAAKVFSKLYDRVARVTTGFTSRSPAWWEVRTQALASAMLGGFSFAQLARAELLQEVARGGLARADALFRVDRAPFCPEVF